jgi:succinoglycan biosynthesis transport protein ExoP
MAIEQEMSFNDYINIIRRRLPYVIGFFFLAFLAAIAIALKLSPVYQSTGTILIESQQVQPDQVKEKYAADRFEALKQVVLTNENLAKIANKYQLFGLDKKPNTPQAGIVLATRANITIDLLKADSGQWGDKPTFAFQVSFNYYKSDETYKVTNDLVKLFLDENDRASKNKATETADFFGKEAEKQKVILEKIEKEVTSYKQKYSNSLPQNKEMQVSSLQRLEEDLRTTQRDYSATQAELRSLDVSMESAKAGIGLNTPKEQDTSAGELEKLKLEYAKLSAIYSENHPSLRALQRRIDALEKSGSASGSAPVKSVTAQSVMVAKVQAQIDSANARLKSLEFDTANIRAKIRQIEGVVLQSAQTEGALGTLERDYENAKVAYAEIKAKQDNSKIAQNIEMQNKGERFVLIEAPLLPEHPIKPNRILIMLAGFFGAIGGAIGLAVLMEALDTRVRGVDALVSIIKIQPLATIPYITNTAELKRNKNIVYYILISALIIILLTLFLVHFFIMPLDILMSKISARF